MKSALVTGGAGFIGSHVVRDLVGEGVQVTVLDDLSGGFRDNVDEDAKFIEGSILDHELIEDLFERNTFDYVYHLAAYAAEGLSHFIRRFNYNNNVIGSMNLINASIRHEIDCFVFTSSIAVYGENQTPMKESLRPQPEDPYGIAKFAVEQDLFAANKLFGLPYVIFRPHNVYGEYQNIGDRYRNVVGIFMNQLMLEQPMTIFGDGTQRRAFSYVGDVSPIIAKAPTIEEARCQIYNVGADAPYTVNELAHAIADAFGAEPRIEYLPARDEVLDAYADHSKARDTFGLDESVSLKDGIKKMADWARSVGPRQSRGYMQTEVSRNLPPSWRQVTAPLS